MLDVNSVSCNIVDYNEKTFIVYYDSKNDRLFCEKELSDDEKKSIKECIIKKINKVQTKFDFDPIKKAMNYVREYQKVKDQHVINRGN
jgi:hypothetical protein